MTLERQDNIKILSKIKSLLGKKRTLEVHGNNSSGINFEQIQELSVQESDDMMGDQLFCHPSVSELESNLHKG